MNLHTPLEFWAVKIGAGAAFLLSICAAAGGHAQEAKQAGEPSHSAGRFQCQMVREIDDLHTGDRWLLMRDTGNGGPGRMVLAGKGSQERTGESGNRLEGRSMQKATPAAMSTNASVIYAGDSIIVEENSPSVQARFEAIALKNAALGASLNVRLVIGRTVVHVTAVGKGRAVLAGWKESWR